MRKQTYTNLTDEEYRTLGTLIRHMGFFNRTDYFTAVAHVTLYGYHTNTHKETTCPDLDPDTRGTLPLRF